MARQAGAARAGASDGLRDRASLLKALVSSFGLRLLVHDSFAGRSGFYTGSLADGLISMGVKLPLLSKRKL